MQLSKRNTRPLNHSINTGTMQKNIDIILNNRNVYNHVLTTYLVLCNHFHAFWKQLTSKFYVTVQLFYLYRQIWSYVTLYDTT